MGCERQKKLDENKAKLKKLEENYTKLLEDKGKQIAEIKGEIKVLDKRLLERFLEDNTVTNCIPRYAKGTLKLMKEYPDLVAVRYRQCNKTGRRFKTVEIKI